MEVGVIVGGRRGVVPSFRLGSVLRWGVVRRARGVLLSDEEAAESMKGTVGVVVESSCSVIRSEDCCVRTESGRSC